MTERRKPPTPKGHEELEAAWSSHSTDLRSEKHASSEGAPKLETPEEPELPTEEAPRDEASPLETPEEPEPRSRPTRLRHRATKTVAVEAPGLGLFAAKAPKSAPLTPLAPEVVALFDHVASNPVDSHAPAWGPRTANPAGGYS